ncbi:MULTISPECIES: hypothetical protein [unclassified Rathayibacter]|uniref:hypothetical protein n=1 Tax=unclassified Rathayibacter TaxID=2609250 RepID=UPI001FB52B4D|nr:MULTISPECIES: hypothetical protein [unclassified Rathayibacter]MCJ1671818.1 hypothetical protein [Rathayibacter sp. VKM Ac-2929]MCJ1684002.1 hypothetical protein [Rathayibacter sp. VKM Ac-2928]
MAAVAGAVAVNANIANKVASLVSRFGNIQKAFEVIYRAWKTTSNAEKRRQAIINAAGDLVLELAGVISIKQACFDS